MFGEQRSQLIGQTTCLKTRMCIFIYTLGNAFRIDNMLEVQIWTVIHIKCSAENCWKKERRENIIQHAWSNLLTGQTKVIKLAVAFCLVVLIYIHMSTPQHNLLHYSGLILKRFVGILG